MSVVCASGYFDPIHAGHIEYLKRAKSLGKTLIVILNTDAQAKKKKGFVMVPVEQRMAVLRELECVDSVIIASDDDGSVCRTLRQIRPHIFAKGGDRTAGEIPEAMVCREIGAYIVDGLGEKIFSSRTVAKNLLASKDIAEGYLDGK